MSVGKVYLIGAGCGKYDLITLRGLRLLQGCDTVVYDSLIDERLLDFVPQSAEKISVGKRAGAHSETQESINEILINKASEGKIVVRLKGGDPFVFGRGGEEITALKERGIPYSAVPGISSAIAVPELAGIPVTHRKTSRSFHVITGHTADELMPENLRKLAALNGTLVFLMGLKNLPVIAKELISGGMNLRTPAAVISQGGTSSQRVVRGTLENIPEIAEREKIIAPAVIVIGETAEYDFSGTISLPFDNVSVTAAGTKHFTQKLSGILEPQGADVERLDLIKIEEYKENPGFDSALKNIGDYGWIVFTSINGAKIFLDRIRVLKIDLRKLSAVKIAVIGKGTADHFKEHGIFPDLVPEKYTSADLGNALSVSVKSGEKVLILRAEKGSAELTEILSENNILFDDIKIYDTKNIGENIYGSTVETDFLTFASASGVKAFFDSGYKASPETKIICIGEITARELSERGINNFSVSKVHTAEGIAETIKNISGRND